MKAAIDLDRVLEAAEEDECIGFCRACGNEQSGVEPDACNYECEVCGEHEVFGAEELLSMMA
jgi:hypothetical protein